MSGRVSRTCGALAIALIWFHAGTLVAAAQAPAVDPATPVPATNAPPTNAPTNDAPEEDIRDIRGPKPIPFRWLWPAILACAAMLAIGAYAAWRWNRRRQVSRAKSLFELALQRLEDIRTLMRPETVREFSIAVSDIVRRYIEDRFHVTAAHRTTEEFLHDLLESSNPSLARHRGLLSEFLGQCDLAKFAGMSLSAQSMETLRLSARTFVLETAASEAANAKPNATPSPAVKEVHDSLPST